MQLPRTKNERIKQFTPNRNRKGQGVSHGHVVAHTVRITEDISLSSVIPADILFLCSIKP